MRVEAVGKTVTLPPPQVIPIRYKKVDKATWMHVGKWGEPPRSVDDDGNPIWVIGGGSHDACTLHAFSALHWRMPTHC